MIDNEDIKNNAANAAEEAEASSADPKPKDDTSDSSSLQGEEGESSHNDASNQADSIPDDNKNDSRVHPNEEKFTFSGPADLPGVLSDLGEHCENLNDMLIWKEELKLLHLDAVVAPPYYELWRAEANDLFRRSVILRSRKRRLKKKGGK